MKNILVMGGAGYIGSHTVKHLMAQGYNCIVADNLVYGHREAVLTPHFELADLADKASLDKVFEKYQIDAVVHFAAYTYVGESVENPQKYFFNNVVGTLNLLEAMLKHNVKKIVFSILSESIIPSFVTTICAVAVALSRSVLAPLVTVPLKIFSATLPPKSKAISSI